MDNNTTGREGFVSLNQFRQARTTTMIHTELRALHSYWNGLRAGRKTPFRAEIDPRDMTCDARNLFILEDLGRGNVRFRLAGSSIVDAFGMELRGMSARSVMSNTARESFVALISETLEEPGIGYARLRPTDGSEGQWEVLLLPLRSDFGDTNRVIGCLLPMNGATPSAGDRPLRFTIDAMSVDPIEATVRDMPGTLPGQGFNDPAPRFERRAPVKAPSTESKPVSAEPVVAASQGQRLQAIDGGLSGAAKSEDAPSDAPPRQKPTLRIVKD